MTKQAPTQTTPAKGSIGKKPVLPFILFPQTQMTRAVANSKRPPSMCMSVLGLPQLLE